jgi:hypothetical protein
LRVLAAQEQLSLNARQFESLNRAAQKYSSDEQIVKGVAKVKASVPEKK